MANEHKRDADYVLGHSAQELAHLSTQARLYGPFTMQFFPRRWHKGRDARAGCWLWQWDVSFLAARMVGPTGEVVGLDRAPASVATATRRALELKLSNARFVQGDLGEIAFGRPFDAVVGRMVLMFCHDPSDTLCKLAAYVRPGGVIAFQEVDFTGRRSLPTLPTFDRCVRWIAESLERSGSDPYLGLKLYATFRTAGLPMPALYVYAGIGAGPDHPLLGRCGSYSNFVACFRRVGPGDPADVDVETLTHRLSDEVVATSGTVVGPSLVGASSRKPEESGRSPFSVAGGGQYELRCTAQGVCGDPATDAP